LKIRSLGIFSWTRLNRLRWSLMMVFYQDYNTRALTSCLKFLAPLQGTKIC